MAVVSDFALCSPRTTPPPHLKLPRSLLQEKGTVSLICVPLLGISDFFYIWYLAHRLRLNQCLAPPTNGHPQTTTGGISSVILGASPGLPWWSSGYSVLPVWGGPGSIPSRGTGSHMPQLRWGAAKSINVCCFFFFKESDSPLTCLMERNEDTELCPQRSPAAGGARLGLRTQSCTSRLLLIVVSISEGCAGRARTLGPARPA